jgi:hypothetical protein
MYLLFEQRAQKQGQEGDENQPFNALVAMHEEWTDEEGTLDCAKAFLHAVLPIEESQDLVRIQIVATISDRCAVSAGPAEPYLHSRPPGPGRSPSFLRVRRRFYAIRLHRERNEHPQPSPAGVDLRVVYGRL